MTDANQVDASRELVLDGNAVAGLLQTVYGEEMTTCPAECASCGSISELGALLAFTHGPGVTLRCPACEQVMIRIAETPRGTYVDSRGAAHIWRSSP